MAHLLPHPGYKTRLNNAIRRIWPRLSDEELVEREERRDLFFIAIRKKHGLARAQAQLFLSELEERLMKCQ